MNRRNLIAFSVVGLGLAGGTSWLYRKQLFGVMPNYSDITYADKSSANRLDIYLPPGDGPFPFVVSIHGGAFLVGDKASETVPRQLIEKNIAVVFLNYRFSSEAIWPAQNDDMMAAIKFLSSEGAKYKLDPQKMGILGQSAGGFLSVSTALSLTEAGTPPLAVADFFGPIDFAKMDEDMAALNRTAQMGQTDLAASAESKLIGKPVGENREFATSIGPIGRLAAMPVGVKLPPIFIRHGDQDLLISHIQSQRLRDAWAQKDSTALVDFELVKGAGHGTGDLNTDVSLKPMAEFFAKFLL